MQQVFTCLNVLEAHVISHLLDAAGIKTTVSGEHLVGARGDLPAHDVCCVWVVDDSDAGRARALILEWEKQNPPPPKTDSPAPQKSGLSVAIGSIIGFFAGAALMYSFFYSPATQKGIDYNGDGKQDVTYFYKNNRIDEVWSDMDFNGAIDRKDFYGWRGLILRTSVDTDFDSTFETELTYQRGNLSKQTSDFNQDGRPDVTLYFSDTGNFIKMDIFDAKTALPVKTIRYKNFKAVSALYDGNQDGIMDVEYTYDEFEEIKNKTPVN
jgi:hypothetical protein